MITVGIPTVFGGPVFSEMFRALSRPRSVAGLPYSELLILYPKGAPVLAHRRVNYPYVRWLCTDSVLSVSAAWNTLCEEASGEFIVLANDDVLFRPSWLLDLYEDSVNMWGAVVSYPECSIDAFWRQDDYGGDIPPPVRGMNGAFFGMPLAVWREVGLFDERFAPCCYEDVDYMYRLDEAGIRYFVSYKHLVGHSGCTTRNSAFGELLDIRVNDGKYHLEANMDRFLKKHKLTAGGLETYSSSVYKGWGDTEKEHPYLKNRREPNESL